MAETSEQLRLNYIITFWEIQMFISIPNHLYIFMLFPLPHPLAPGTVCSEYIHPIGTGASRIRS